MFTTNKNPVRAPVTAPDLEKNNKEEERGFSPEEEGDGRTVRKGERERLGQKKIGCAAGSEL